MSAIATEALRKVFSPRFGRSVEALKGVDLVIPEGTAFGLIGPNGAGKTTFVKAILGVLHPTSGEVTVLGGSPHDPAVRERVGYLPERLHLPRAWKPIQYLASIARLKRLALGHRELIEALRRVGLADEAQRKIGGFSKGMKQRLGLAAALLGAPRLLVLDEPTDGIDPMGRIEVRHILHGERERGTTILLNSHLLSDTERICDRIGILAGGRLVQSGSLEELRRRQGCWTLRVAPGAPEGALLEAGLAPAGAEGVWHYEAGDPAALNAVIDRVRASGALLTGLSRDERPLEELFAEAVGGVR